MIEVQSTVGVGTTFTIMLPVPTEEDSLPAEA
jgi:signal transduction histidine kinase